MPLQNQKHRLSALGVLAMLAGGFLGQLPYVYASSWSPTLLVNTEAFQVIDDTDSAADLYIQFGDSLNKRLTYDRTIGTFIFDDDLEVVGTASGRHLHAQDLLTSSGQTIIEGNQAYDPALLYVDQNSTSGSGQLIDSEATNQAGLMVDMPGINYTDANDLALNPHILFGYNGLFDTDLYRQKADTLKTDDSLWVKQTVSGATIRSFGLTDCDNGTDDKLLWDATTGTFSCGTDQGAAGGSGFSGTGALQAFFDNRYVEVSGDTMTGALIIDPDADTTGMFRINDADGGNPVFNVDSTNERVGIGTASPSGIFDISGDVVVKQSSANDGGVAVGIGTDSPTRKLDVVATDEVETIRVQNSNNVANDGWGFNIRDNGDLFWNESGVSNGVFSIAAGAGSNALAIDSDANVGVGTNAPDATLEVVGSASGSSLHAQDNLSSSGTLALEGGFYQNGLGDCDNGTTGKLLWNADDGTFSCGTDTDTHFSGTGSLQAFFDDRYVNTSGDTMTGSLTVEGNLTFGDAITDTITVNARFASSLIPDTDDTYDLGSSSLRWRDVYVGPASLHIGTDGNEAQIGYDTTGNEIEFDANDDGTPEVVFEDGGSVGIGTEAPETTLEVIGSLSGASLDVSGDTSVAGTLTTDTLNEYTTDNGVTIDGLSIQDGYADASAIKMDSTDSNVTRTVQDTHNYLNPAGRITGGGITDNGNGTVTVAAGSGYIRTGNVDTASLQFVQWAESGSITIASGDTKYFGVGYRSGSPAVIMKNSNVWNYNTEFPLNTATNDGGTMEVSNNLQAITAAGGVLKRFYETRPLERDERTGGLIISETGTRNIAVTAGAMWARLSRVTIDAIDTSNTDTFDRYYRDGSGGFTKQSAQTQWDNTRYDDGSGTLQTMTNNRYSVQWFYVETDGDLVSVYGDDQYTNASSAEAAEAPDTVPNRLTEGGKLIGRIIFQKDDNTAIAVQNVFTTEFPTTLANDHGNLGGLTDDDHTQYALLAGRSGGQTLIGGTDAGDNLTFNSTSNGTKGKLFFGSSAAFDEVNTRLGIGTTTPETALEIVGTVSGSTVHAQDLLTSSGTLVTEGQVTFANLANCDTIDTDANGVLSCGTDGGLTQSTADARYVEIGGDTMTGALVFDPDTDSTSLLRVNDADGGNPVFTVDSTNERVGIGTASPATELDVVGTVSGSTIRSFGLTDCDSSSQALQWDETTGTFSCGSAGGLTQSVADARYVEIAGDTMTGALTIDNEGAEPSLNVRGTASGEHLHFGRLLTGSGQMIIEGNQAFEPATIFLDQNANGSGQLIDSEATGHAGLIIDMAEIQYDGAGEALNPHILFGYANTFDTDIYRSAAKTLSTRAHFVPANNDSQTLGTDNKRWKDLFLGPDTLHIGTSTADEATLSYNTSTNDLEIESDGDLVFQPTTGNVGIGTSSPNGIFEVLGSNGSPTQGAFLIDNNGMDVTIGQLSDTIGKSTTFQVIDRNGAVRMEVDNASDITLGTNNSVFVESSNNRVGLHTDIPDADVEIESTNANWSGALLVDMNTAASGTGVMVYSESDDSPGLAISMTDDNAVDNPHILFGYENIFDTKLWRNTGSSLRTNGDFIIDGSVGIGAENPSSELDIVDSSSTAAIEIDGASTFDSAIDFREAGNQRWYMYNQGSNDRFYILDADDDVAVYMVQNGTSWVSGSDERLKENVAELSVLDRLKDFRAVSFDWKSNGRKDLGVIAQELEKVFPEIVSKGSDGGELEGPTDPGTWGVEYAKIGPLALQGVKELDMKLEEHLKFGAKLSGRLDDFATALEQVQADIADIQERLPEIDGNGTVLTIDDGTIDLSGTYHIVASQDGNRDTLANISGGTLNQMLVLQAAPDQKITVRKTGKILLTQGDYLMDKPGDVLVLMKAADDMWVELSRTGGNANSLNSAIQQYQSVFNLSN